MKSFLRSVIGKWHAHCARKMNRNRIQKKKKDETEDRRRKCTSTKSIIAEDNGRSQLSSEGEGHIECVWTYCMLVNGGVHDSFPIDVSPAK